MLWKKICDYATAHNTICIDADAYTIKHSNESLSLYYIQDYKIF